MAATGDVRYLTVGNGSGDGSYLEGAVVSVTADPAPSSEVFDQWTGDVTAVGNVFSAAMSVTIPATDVTITATYHAQVSTGVTGFTLMNADTDQPVAGFDPLVDGAVVNLALLPTTALNIRADTTGSTGAISFVLNGRLYRVESVPPYALAGDRNGDYRPWTPSPGAHTLTATPEDGTPATVSFTVTEDPG